MKQVSFTKINNDRKNFMKKNQHLNHVVITGNNKVLLSAPHGVSQVRLGKLKFKEVGSLATALYLQKETNSFLIAKTKNNNDDANFDEKSEYKDTIYSLIETKGIKYVIDFHGLAAKRDCDINLGIFLGKNIENNVRIFDSLNKSLQKEGFIVYIDQPFMAASHTISRSVKYKYPDLWSLQIEINCKITNNAYNIIKYNKLLRTLKHWLKSLN